MKVVEARVKDLDKEVNELTIEVVIKFDRGFDTALAQLQVLHPEVDISRFGRDKIVVNGQIVAQAATANRK